MDEETFIRAILALGEDLCELAKLTDGGAPTREAEEEALERLLGRFPELRAPVSAVRVKGGFEPGSHDLLKWHWVWGDVVFPSLVLPMLKEEPEIQDRLWNFFEWVEEALSRGDA